MSDPHALRHRCGYGLCCCQPYFTVHSQCYSCFRVDRKPPFIDFCPLLGFAWLQPKTSDSTAESMRPHRRFQVTIPKLEQQYCVVSCLFPLLSTGTDAWRTNLCTTLIQHHTVGPIVCRVHRCGRISVVYHQSISQRVFEAVRQSQNLEPSAYGLCAGHARIAIPSEAEGHAVLWTAAWISISSNTILKSALFGTDDSMQGIDSQHLQRERQHSSLSVMNEEGGVRAFDSATLARPEIPLPSTRLFVMCGSPQPTTATSHLFNSHIAPVARIITVATARFWIEYRLDPGLSSASFPEICITDRQPPGRPTRYESPTLPCDETYESRPQEVSLESKEPRTDGQR
jgi:hypothetical protein